MYECHINKALFGCVLLLWEHPNSVNNLQKVVHTDLRGVPMEPGRVWEDLPDFYHLRLLAVRQLLCRTGLLPFSFFLSFFFLLCVVLPPPPAAGYMHSLETNSSNQTPAENHYCLSSTALHQATCTGDEASFSFQENFENSKSKTEMKLQLKTLNSRLKCDSCLCAVLCRILFQTEKWGD